MYFFGTFPSDEDTQEDRGAPTEEYDEESAPAVKVEDSKPPAKAKDTTAKSRDKSSKHEKEPADGEAIQIVYPKPSMVEERIKEERKIAHE